MQVGLDKQTSANCKAWHWFWLDKQCWALVLTSTKYFQSAAAWADGILIPNLHKALHVGSHLRTQLLMINQSNWQDYLKNLLTQNGQFKLVDTDQKNQTTLEFYKQQFDDRETQIKVGYLSDGRLITLDITNPKTPGHNADQVEYPHRVSDHQLRQHQRHQPGDTECHRHFGRRRAPAARRRPESAEGSGFVQGRLHHRLQVE